MHSAPGTFSAHASASSQATPAPTPAGKRESLGTASTKPSETSFQPSATTPHLVWGYVFLTGVAAVDRLASTHLKAVASRPSQRLPCSREPPDVGVQGVS